MKKQAMFTICAKNYLAQALTLKDSVKKNNPNTDFFIFLADQYDNSIKDIDLVLLDNQWISNWESMAFKYNVIEFSTSIKPFCFNKLFAEGYEKVLYLDPDIYVIQNLDYIYNILDNKSIILTPHYCEIINNYNGAVSEETFMADGVFNLGFVGIKNDTIGNKICKWWAIRLREKCYADIYNSLFVDQKWMDFIPAFFPNETEISQHLGMNVAIWNLHERELVRTNNQYFIKSYTTNKLYELLFFHFSGFDPYNTKVINRRHSEYNINTFPTYKPLIEEYSKKIYEFGYERFSKLTYNFNKFENGEEKTEINQRLYRVLLEKAIVSESENPFSVQSKTYKILNTAHLLTHNKSDKKLVTAVSSSEASKFEHKILFPLLRIIHKILGNRYYYQIIKVSRRISKFEYHYFLLNKTCK